MSKEQPQVDQEPEEPPKREGEKDLYPPLGEEQKRDPVEESSDESFPASDPPSWIPEHV